MIVGRRIENSTVNISPSDVQKDDLPQLAQNILDNLDSKRTSDRLRAFGTQLSVMRYLEKIQSTIWCGYIEFREPSLSHQKVRTAKVVVKSETDGWSWNHVSAWDRSFSRTIKVTSQQYNFFPVKPRARICGVTENDQDIVQSISSRLEASDQVMTLRSEQSNGFILRIVSPEQAHQRLARLGASLVATFTILPNSLVCSWECPDMNVSTLSDSDKIETIDRMVRELDGDIL
jgi:chorismate mutase